MLFRSDTCFENQFGTDPQGLLGKYYSIEDFPPVQFAFACYTSGTCFQDEPLDQEGEKVLGILAHLEGIIDPGPSIDKPYKDYLSPDEKCPGSPENPTLSDRADCLINKVQNLQGTKTPVAAENRW